MFVSVQSTRSDNSILINRDHISSVRWAWRSAAEETIVTIKVVGEENTREIKFGRVTEAEMIEKMHELTGTDLEAVDVDAQQ